ncbi:MAG: arginyl-tRNA--protein transferase 1 [Chitinophagales bacterium]|nr:arginyl-tRNA--protein transferase 1 [Chitinophagales bacterium]
MHKTRIVDYVFMTQLHSQRFDNLLSLGYFRNANIMFQSQVLCLDGKLDDTINIRVPLQQHSFPRHIKKIANRVEKRFVVEMGEVETTVEKETLFNHHRKRFKGFQFHSLWQLLYGDNYNNIFESKEISIYDGSKLIAFSIFDVGENSLASIVGVFDEEYARYSLGIYTMYAEMMWAKENGYQYYYPGYIMRKNHLFDYKMRVGEVQALDWDKNIWTQLQVANQGITASQKIYVQLENIKNELSKLKIDYEVKIYPFYSLAYLTSPNFHNYLKTPIHILLPQFSDGSKYVIIDYDLEGNLFSIANVVYSDINEDIRTWDNISADDSSRSNECRFVLEYINIERFYNVDSLIDFLKRRYIYKSIFY